MTYIALYRKYRSQSFGEVIGQQHVTTSLQNALRLGRIAHAYLFCGPRGCGKTSTARLLARALNCQAGDSPTSDPCGQCDMCLRIRDGSAMDVIEMDAASETGIDDVREKIIENAKYAPGEARYKVYIIDEVHDLSLKAFDSLLKTIEEPPSHVVFILATTEAHKVPITVRSRCQRMDFRRATLEDLIGNICHVLTCEKIEYEIEAIAAIARAAEGSFRDSLSLLEQVTAYTEGQLTAEAVHAAIGTVGAAALDRITHTLASDDLSAAFLMAGELVEAGRDVKQILVALQLHLRDLLIAGISNSPQALTDVSAERFTQLKEQARCFTAPQLLKMLDVLAEAERDIRFTNQHRLLLEKAFWNLLPSSVSSVAPPSPPAIRAADWEYEAQKASGSTWKAPPTSFSEERAEAASTRTQVDSPASDSLSSADAASPQNGAGSLPSPTDGGRFAAAIDLESLRRSWPRVIRRLTQTFPSAKAVFTTEEVQLVRLENHLLFLGFQKKFLHERADRPRSREAVEKALAAELGIEGLKVRCILIDGSGDGCGPDEPKDRPDGSGPDGSKVPTSGDGPDEGGPRSLMGSLELTEPEAPRPDEEFLTLVLEEFKGKLIDE